MLTGTFAIFVFTFHAAAAAAVAIYRIVLPDTAGVVGFVMGKEGMDVMLSSLAKPRQCVGVCHVMCACSRRVLSCC